jgi:hypothetical protein
LDAVPDGGGECPAVADELRVQHNNNAFTLFQQQQQQQQELID